jgi:hypothetical protein
MRSMSGLTACTYACKGRRDRGLEKGIQIKYTQNSEKSEKSELRHRLGGFHVSADRAVSTSICRLLNQQETSRSFWKKAMSANSSSGMSPTVAGVLLVPTDGFCKSDVRSIWHAQEVHCFHNEKACTPDRCATLKTDGRSKDNQASNSVQAVHHGISSQNRHSNVRDGTQISSACNPSFAHHYHARRRNHGKKGFGKRS